MATKIIKNINEDAWNRFGGYCRTRSVKMGEELSSILDNFLNNDKLQG